jgi:hypothetical protein
MAGWLRLDPGFILCLIFNPEDDGAGSSETQADFQKTTKKPNLASLVSLIAPLY